LNWLVDRLLHRVGGQFSFGRGQLRRRPLEVEPGSIHAASRCVRARRHHARDLQSGQHPPEWWLTVPVRKVRKVRTVADSTMTCKGVMVDRVGQAINYVDVYDRM